ncbi:hypothetical protein HMPREF9372_0045 [Sporosarcina newyorkensis 2681]|uniref:CbiN domain protein n=1 Tax=Sporosarcina newyorkensis 2681 TaxID=1027292 RepID=F9DML5_9BACL|nr:hypothetical protein [Sporosarcina newyorkensis]EGQ27937.1 hypothetical protein HMPREF9372_0045 [Sporosarcina newyorkensis 2681]
MAKGNATIVRVKFIILFIIPTSFVFNYLPNTSYACSCVEPGTVKEEMTQSSAVFSGKVIEIADKNQNNSMQSSADPIAVVFEVEESWKGINQTQVVVYTERSSASCGFEFSLHNEYLFYAHENTGNLNASICSRTTLLSAADQDMQDLGKGERSTEQISIDLTTENSKNTNQLYIYLLIVALFLGGGYITLKRRTKK